MKITLNGMELQRRAEGNITVAEVLRGLTSEVQQSGKWVTAVALDGQKLSNDRNAQYLLNSAVSRHLSLDLRIDEPAQLRQRALADSRQLLQQLQQQSKPLGLKFRVGDEVTANNDLAHYLEELKLVVTGLDYCTRPQEAGRPRVMAELNRLLPVLDRVYKAQAATDYIALADEIEYELPELYAEWEELCRHLSTPCATPDPVS